MLGNVDQDKESLLNLLQESVQRTNEALYRINQQNDINLGTTVTVALIIGSNAYIASVGDSRIYLYRFHTLSQITHDHSVVAQLIEDGLIMPADAYTHPKRNQLYRNIGRKSEVEVDLFTIPIQVGDKLLLCSDGLWQMVHKPDIQHIMEDPVAEPVQMVDELIQAALRGGGRDNVSAVVVFAL